MRTFRVGDDYIETREDIYIIKHGKVFSTIDESINDFSVDVTIPNTSVNRAILGLPQIDSINKTIYQTVEASVIDHDGDVLYRGKLRVQAVNKREITVAFFSGVYNWMTLIDGNLTDLDFSFLDNTIQRSTIEDSWLGDEGAIFPMADFGAMIGRSHQNFKSEDFTQCVFAKVIVREILQKAGIKLKGELITNPIYNSLIIAKNSKSKQEIEASSCYVEKSTTTARPTENIPELMTFQNVTTAPFFNGSNNCFDLGTNEYTAPYKMRAKVECTLTPSIVNASYNNRIYVYINGVFSTIFIGLDAGTLYGSSTEGSSKTFTYSREIELEEGDVITIKSEWQQSGGSTQNDVLSGTLRITPIFIYKAFGNASVPNWTKKQFMKNIFNMFNIVTDYDPITKELTANFFDKIRTKTQIDLSEYVSIENVDYNEFISNYGKKNYLSYSNTDNKDVTQPEDLLKYNVREFIKYGQGIIEANNDFLEESKDMIKLDFAAPVSYLHPSLAASIERMNFLDLEAGDEYDFATVSNDTDSAQLNFSTAFPFMVGDLIRITESTQPEYNGDWVVGQRTVDTGAPEYNITCIGLTYKGNARGKVAKLQHVYTDSDDVFPLISIPNYPEENFSGAEDILVDDTIINDPAIAFFSLINTGRQINQDYTQSLTFGDINNPLFYQRTLIDTYWRQVGSILNDPVKLKAICYLPKKVFRQLNPITPVYIKTEETVNAYYLEVVNGYLRSDLPCEVELIKL